MLIRIVDHFKDNPKRIDKLIAIKGLPEDWFFRESPEGKELKRPWEPDIDKNIPHDIRHLCEPMYIVRRYAPLNANTSGVTEKSQILGVRIDYNSEPGRQLWDDIERYVEESLPRSERIPVPVVCARDERSAFETYTPRRTSRGALEMVPSDVPMVDLTKYVEVRMETKVPEAIPAQIVAEPVIKPVDFKCETCEYTHKSKQGIRMHTLKRHPKKEKAGVA
jgi:hypothetical protein